MQQDSDRRTAATRNRERMPETARIVDAFRAVFGDGVRLRWAREGDVEVGVKREERCEQRR